MSHTLSPTKAAGNGVSLVPRIQHFWARRRSFTSDEAVHADAVKEAHDEARAQAMRRCQAKALENVVTRDRSRAYFTVEEKGLVRMKVRAGMYVRIWALLSKNAGVVAPLLHAGSYWDPHQVTHIVSEMGWANDRECFTVGLTYQEEDMKKPHSAEPGSAKERFELLAHTVAHERAQMDSPDTTFDWKVDQQRLSNRPGDTFLKLLAVGTLSNEAVDKLRRLARTSEPMQEPYRHSRGIPDIPTYRMLAPAYRDGVSVFNCASFATYLFPDLIACTNRVGMSDPTRCEALNIRELGFMGCNEEGTLSLVRDVMAELEGGAQPREARRRRLTTARSRSARRDSRVPRSRSAQPRAPSPSQAAPTSQLMPSFASVGSAP